jgi:hypothetical protein
MTLSLERTKELLYKLPTRLTYLQLFHLYGGLLGYLLGLHVFTVGFGICFEGLLALIFV